MYSSTSTTANWTTYVNTYKNAFTRTRRVQCRITSISCSIQLTLLSQINYTFGLFAYQKASKKIYHSCLLASSAAARNIAAIVTKWRAQESSFPEAGRESATVACLYVDIQRKSGHNCRRISCSKVFRWRERGMWGVDEYLSLVLMFPRQLLQVHQRSCCIINYCNVQCRMLKEWKPAVN